SPEPHSALGIASFVIFLLTILAYCGVAIESLWPPPPGELTEGYMLVVLGGLCAPPSNVVGIALGACGFAQARRKRRFAAWGLALNAAVFGGFWLLIAIFGK